MDYYTFKDPKLALVFGEYLLDWSTMEAIRRRIESGWIPVLVLSVFNMTTIEQHQELEQKYGKENVFHYQYGAFVKFEFEYRIIPGPMEWHETRGINVYFIR